MIAKTYEREKAIELRKQGLSYNEIRQQVVVSKSSLAAWLHAIGLAKHQRQRLTEKKKLSLQRGWKAWHDVRINKTSTLIREAKNEIGSISSRELWLLGVMLYWAEGSKQKPHNVSQGLIFSNGDPLMIKLFLRWLREIIRVKDAEMVIELYIHESCKPRISAVYQYWNDVLKNKFASIRTYYKRNKIRSIRRNNGENYYGVIRIRVRKSTDLNRRITGWIQGVCENSRVV